MTDSPAYRSVISENWTDVLRMTSNVQARYFSELQTLHCHSEKYTYMQKRLDKHLSHKWN